MSNRSSTILSLLTGASLLVLPRMEAADVQTLFTYSSSVTQQSNPWINLKAELNYNDAAIHTPSPWSCTGISRQICMSSSSIIENTLIKLTCS